MDTRHFILASVKQPRKPLRAMYLQSAGNPGASLPRFAATHERALSFESFDAAKSVATGVIERIASMRTDTRVGDWTVVPLEV